MQLPIQSAPVLRYTPGNLTIATSATSAKAENQMAIVRRNTSVSSSANNVSPSAWCVGARVQNRRVCLSLPVVGSVCIPIPLPLPNFTLVRACVSTCTTWGVPTGACVRLTGPGGLNFRRCFGFGC